MTFFQANRLTKARCNLSARHNLKPVPHRFAHPAITVKNKMQAKRLRQLAPSTRVETKNADLVMPQASNQYARLVLNQSVSIQD